MTEREFQNMFTFAEGFEAASLKLPTPTDDEQAPRPSQDDQIIGFARFITRQHALAAADILSGRKVDQEKSMVLKAEMAKKNLHFKKSATPSVVGAPDGTNSTAPTTATASHLEDSTFCPFGASVTAVWLTPSPACAGLRNAFSRCPGFKRLQFRSKSNGPIVFVEFVDTAHATRAMQELYGHTLGGLVKGGIRLSYSKNPLGVRSN
ncbi:hypothetical protein RHOSPDRAFT_5921, partial [Rhodotorula sp. JG-1b]